MLTNTKSELNKIKWQISINSWLYSFERKKIDRKKTLEAIERITKEIYPSIFKGGLICHTK